MSAHRRNPVDTLKTYTIYELERIAEQFHDNIPKGYSVPVDIDLILENTPGVDFDIYPRLRANHGILGMVGPNDDGTLIVYIDDELADQDSMLRRYRMTLAEELAHVLLHRSALESVKGINDFKEIISHPRWSIYDRNAKRLAAALLMPAKSLKIDGEKLYTKIINALPQEVKYTNPEVVIKYMKSQLSVRYEVSSESMGYRLSEWPIKMIEKVKESMHEKLDFLI